MPIQASELRPGMAMEYKDGIYEILDWEFMKPGKGCAYVKIKAKNIETGRSDDITWKSTEKVEQAYIDRREYEYLYRDGELFILMEPETYEQIEVTLDKMEALLPFLKENNMVTVASCEGKVLYVLNKDFVEMEVVEAEPAVKGDTAGTVVKNCVIETGVGIKVPHFVEAGMKIKIDTRTGTYVGRV